MFLPEIKRLAKNAFVSSKLDSAFARLRNVHKKAVIADIEEEIVVREKQL
jgi:hypothetical protein